eukprot:gene9940-13373_t
MLTVNNFTIFSFIIAIYVSDGFAFNKISKNIGFASSFVNKWSILYSSRPANEYDARRKATTPPPPINQFIRADRVRLIVPNNDTDDSENGEGETMLGIMSLKEALQEAENRDLDLVMINDKADPPVCKVIDYGKYKYIQEKKKKENMKKQVKVDIKEVKMSYKIDQHDFDVRVRAVQKFLSDGDRVKIVVQFKGREMQHKDLGQELLMKMFQPLSDVASMEGTPKLEGRSMTMLVGPKNK